MSKLGDRLRSLMRDKKLSVATLAKAGGISESTLQGILGGDIARPPDARLRGFAKALGVSFDSLLQLIPAKLREAAATDLSARSALVVRAVRESINGGGPERVYIDVQAVYPDRIVIGRDGRSYAYPYTIDNNNQVQLGTPQEVVLDHTAVSMREAQQVFIESQDEQGLKWRVLIINAGLSGNKNYYPDAVLREATALFDGARVFVKSDEEHLAGKGKSFRNLIGRITQPVFIEGRGVDQGKLEGVLELLSTADDVPAKLLEAWNRNMAQDLFGFSIDANGTAKVAKGRRTARKITKVNSVDLIIEPGAGGQIINLIEALNHEDIADMKLRDRMIEAVKAAHNGTLPDGLDVDNDEALETAYREALKPDNPPEAKAAEAAAAQSGAAAQGVSQEQLDDSLRMVEARANMRVSIAECGLPEAARTKLRKHFDGMDRFTEAQVGAAIKDERDYLAKFTESGNVSGLGGDSHIGMGKDRSEQVEQMLEAFFDPNNRDVISFKECYIEITGDTRVTGHLRDCNQARMREATGFREALGTTGLDQILGDAIHRVMLADYAETGQYDVWRPVSNVVPLNDFRTQHRPRWGGYGDLPTVAENGPYTALTSPTDEEATYAPSKRGGKETLSLEAIKNDDVGFIRRIPITLSRAAKRTLAKFVLDFIATNPVIYDTVALFAAGHNNLGTAALSATSLAAGRLAMLQQTESGSGDRIGIGPKSILVPGDLEEAAVNLFRRTTENDKTFTQSLTLDVLPVWYWTDVNDWALSADPLEVPTIEIGFMDGQEEPELFVQDSPTQGSLFSNDQITYKIRHIYGGNVVDFRGLYKAVVA